jgi:hypothetical protein
MFIKFNNNNKFKLKASLKGQPDLFFAVKTISK